MTMSSLPESDPHNHPLPEEVDLDALVLVALDATEPLDVRSDAVLRLSDCVEHARLRGQRLFVLRSLGVTTTEPEVLLCGAIFGVTPCTTVFMAMQTARRAATRN
jgi:hypothetical protein